MGTKDRLQVRVNDELVLDAGTCEDASGPNGPERIVHPPTTTLFHQVLGYLREKPDPSKRSSGSMVGREGVAATAAALRWGSYLAVLLDSQLQLPIIVVTVGKMAARITTWRRTGSATRRSVPHDSLIRNEGRRSKAI